MATWAATTFCTVSDVRDRAPDIDAPLSDSKRGVGSKIITAKIALAKDLMRQRVLEYAATAYPSCVADWIARHIEQYDRAADTATAMADRWNVDRVDSPGVPVWNEGATDLLGSTMRPQTFFVGAAPTNGTSGTFAGAAENGAYLADTTNQRLYINQGTTASPTWTAFTPEMMIDYITNPAELKHACVAGALWLLYEDRASRFTANHAEGLDKYVGWMNHWKSEFTGELSRALKLLAVDISNDGTVTEWERSATRRSHWIF